LIRKGLAYVDDQTQEQIREGRGTVSEPGKESPWRNRSAEENLDLFERMKAGEFADGEKVLRAKIDMAHPNMLFRDPIMYRIIHARHHRTGDKWCIYPMYDYAHGQSDSIEHITHSICTLEFDVHRPLYDWFIGTYRSRRVSLAAQGADRRHTWVVPAHDGALLHEFQQFAFRHHRVGQVQPCELVLVRRPDAERLDEPVVERTVDVEFERADRVGDVLDRVALPSWAGTTHVCRRSAPCAARDTRRLRYVPSPKWWASPNATT